MSREAEGNKITYISLLPFVSFCQKAHHSDRIELILYITAYYPIVSNSCTSQTKPPTSRERKMHFLTQALLTTTLLSNLVLSLPQEPPMNGGGGGVQGNVHPPLPSPTLH